MTYADIDSYTSKRQREIGKKVKAVRRAYGWSQTDLAEFLGCSRARINRAETGTTALNIAELELMALKFETTILDLLGWRVSTQIQQDHSTGSAEFPQSAFEPVAA